MIEDVQYIINYLSLPLELTCRYKEYYISGDSEYGPIGLGCRSLPLLYALSLAMHNSYRDYHMHWITLDREIF